MTRASSVFPNDEGERSRLLERFVAHGVAALDRRAADGSRFKKDNRIVTVQFSVETTANRGEVIMHFTRPVRRAIDRSPIAEQRAGRVERSLHILEMPLHMVDRRLRKPPRLRFRRTRKPALKKNRRRFRQKHDALPDLPPEEISSRGLPAARTSCEDDATTTRVERLHWKDGVSGAGFTFPKRIRWPASGSSMAASAARTAPAVNATVAPHFCQSRPKARLAGSAARPMAQ